MLLPLVGVALNGTSSVLYGSVPDLVEPARRQRAFGIFYTGTIGAGAVSPALYGLLGDALGVPSALVVVAAVVLLTLPITLALRPALATVKRPDPDLLDSATSWNKASASVHCVRAMPAKRKPATELPMTAEQAARLKQLAIDAYEPGRVQANLTQAEAQRRIAVLSAKLPLLDEPPHTL